MSPGGAVCDLIDDKVLFLWGGLGAGRWIILPRIERTGRRVPIQDYLAGEDPRCRMISGAGIRFCAEGREGEMGEKISEEGF